jgi:DNA-binding MarR family transcriptional regulator
LAETIQPDAINASRSSEVNLVETFACLVRAKRLLGASVDRQLNSEHGITIALLSAMRELSLHPLGTDTEMLAAALGTSLADADARLRELKKARLATQPLSSNDGARLSLRGARLLADADRTFELALNRQLEATLSPSELSNLVSALDELQAAELSSAASAA